MYDSKKDKQVDDDIAELEAKNTLGYSKAQQIGKTKEKKKGTFGKKPTVWNNNKKSTTPKIKNFDIVDDKYSKWLGKQKCCISGISAPRGAGVNDIHCHHIRGRTPRRNDYEQVPLIGWLHSWGGKSYHDNTKEDFIKKNLILVDNIIEFFEEMAKYYQELYVEQGGVIKN